jgi:bifunctional non-homologous end joining protein LigD
MATHSLNEYQRKRDFKRSQEPAGEAAAVQAGHLYVMHKHAAKRLHFDLRLEQDGVLRSWALPKGPALERGGKRLAVQVEDHPLEYGSFEGSIPKGEYGAGTVMIWDAGLWQPDGRNDDDQIDFILSGSKLKGAWTLVRIRERGTGRKGKSWLLVKRTDHPQQNLSPDDLSVVSGRSMAEIAAEQELHAAALPQRPAPPVASELEGARRAEPPAILPPQLATPSERAPAGRNWLHEIKFDGYRIVAHLEHGKARLLTRNGLDWSARLRAQAKQLETLPVQQAILDGELVALSAGGASSFRELQEALSRKQTAQLSYQLFDLLYLDGHDLSALPLLERKQALLQLLQAAGYDPASSGGILRYSDHVQGQGPDFFEQACTLGLEGIISKRADAPYRSGRSKLWLKAKCTTQQAEFVVGGYTPPAGSRSGFGALLLGNYRDGRLQYAGRLGTGFSQRQLEQLHAQLQQQEIAHSPFVASASLPATRGVHWVAPQLVVAVEYVERTRDGLLRQPSFLGIREDIEPAQIDSPEATLEEAAPASASGAVRHPASGAVEIAGTGLSHPERILYPEQGVTKLALARYYESIHEWMLPYLARRPLVLLRCPEGREACFYQKHLGKTQASAVPRIAIAEGKTAREYVYVRSLADILSLVQHGVLEFHAWGCHVEDIEHPDLLVFDLDPDAGVAWPEVLRTARELRERLQGVGLTAFVRTTGGKGLHLVVPLRSQADGEMVVDWDTLKAFARAVSEQHAQDEPRLLTTNMAKSKRHGRIFLDYLRNGRGATAIASYSVRARPGAPVAVPLRWDELSPALRSDYYSVGTLRRRLSALKADPWQGFFEAAVPLSATMLKAVGVNEPKN